MDNSNVILFALEGNGYLGLIFGEVIYFNQNLYTPNNVSKVI